MKVETKIILDRRTASGARQLATLLDLEVKYVYGALVGMAIEGYTGDTLEADLPRRVGLIKAEEGA